MAQSNADQLATLFRKAALAHDRALAPVGARDPHVPVELYAFLIELYVNEMPALVDVELDKKRVELDWNVRIASANGSQRSVMRKSCLAEEGGELIGIGLSHEGVPSRGLTDRA